MPKLVNTEIEFQTEINQGRVLVDFYADWCGPCKMQGPILEKYTSLTDKKAKVVKVDVDTLGVVAEKYNVFSIPTLVLFVDGKEVARKVGFLPLEPLKRFIDSI